LRYVVFVSGDCFRLAILSARFSRGRFIVGFWRFGSAVRGGHFRALPQSAQDKRAKSGIIVSRALQFNDIRRHKKRARRGIGMKIWMTRA